MATSFSARTGIAVLAALLGPGLLAGLRPSNIEDVVGGRARPVQMPAEPGVTDHGTYLMPTALVRRLTRLEVLLGRRGERADAPGEMELAKADAWWAALALLGPQAKVTAVRAGSAADAAGLRPADVLVAIDGGQVGLVTLISLTEPPTPQAEASTVRVLRDGTIIELSIPTGHRGDITVAINLGTPAAPTIDTGEVAGASGGLVMALVHVDLLTPGDLTGGRVVAATGMIRPDGVVRGVLAYEHKAKAAAKAGATVLLVSDADADQVRLSSPDGLEVVGVNTLNDAVQALCRLGGESTLCTSGDAGPALG